MSQDVCYKSPVLRLNDALEPDYSNSKALFETKVIKQNNRLARYGGFSETISGKKVARKILRSQNRKRSGACVRRLFIYT
jgi:hypothetical protein